ncbi:hypothetical protein [Mesorhizobium sp. WSM4312]|uniref:hypothetical protein n=1 Tax=Mesorhizobium sp. WSM4312 TaxID=2029411 RepID=UPI0015C80BB4|nr:hypothetical protein [Mesorhizobium sp. WSM4312]
MTLAAAMPTIGAATMTSAVVAIMRLVEPLATGNSFALRAFFRCGQNHAPKDKGNRADKHQQENSEMHPSG